ncbi:PqiC family protein (plasmid) [Pseudoalteromonas sp. T1lg65]|uniref:PqiC family protein n=1 Tax=Pseudoalteromonas sp. T1lg65 TaxID=2077101 RepID=UPI003F795114
MNRLFIALGCLLALCGCINSATEAIKYYRLELSNTSPATTAKNANLILVDDVKLAELFDQQPLIQYLANNEVNIASYHYWAQSPSDMLTTSLIERLQLSAQSVLSSSRALQAPEQHLRLQLEIDEFAGHHAQGAVLKGTWYLYQYQSDNYQLRSATPYQFYTDLNGNGFSALVQAHQANVEKLFAELTQKLKD